MNIFPKNPNDPSKLAPNEIRKVLIIGGDLAGLSAALKLSDRVCNVTIKEKDDTGGRLATRSVQLLCQNFYVVFMVFLLGSITISNLKIDETG